MGKKISIIIPTYNRPDYINRCLDAIFKQSYTDFEVIVVDSGSINNEYIKNYNIHYFKQKTNSPGCARNIGIKHATADIIAFTDDDCLPDKDWLKNAIGYFDDKSVIGVEGMTINDGEITPTSLPVINIYGGKRPTCNILYRKGILNQLNGFDEHFKFSGEDVNLAFRAEKIGKIVFAKEAIVIHPIKHFTIIGFIKNHINIKKTYWQVLGAKTFHKYFSFEMLIYYPLFASLILLLIKPNWYTLVFMIHVYLTTVLFHNLYLTKGRLMDIFRHKKTLIKLIFVWWTIILADVLFRIAGMIKFRKVML